MREIFRPTEDKEPDLLTRLKNIQDRAALITESSQARQKSLEFGTPEWERQVRILKSQARTKAISDGRPQQREIIDQLVIIEDGKLPDAHKNEIEISNFIKSYL